MVAMLKETFSAVAIGLIVTMIGVFVLALFYSNIIGILEKTHYEINSAVMTEVASSISALIIHLIASITVLKNSQNHSAFSIFSFTTIIVTFNVIISHLLESENMTPIWFNIFFIAIGVALLAGKKHIHREHQ